jgi:hypothetical protein
MRGTEDQFDVILKKYYDNVKSYEGKNMNYVGFSANIDALFAYYGWSKKEFFKELNARIGIQTNQERKNKTIEASKKKASKKTA